MAANSHILLVVIVICLAISWPCHAARAADPVGLECLRWPEGTQVLPFEDVDGAILVQATLTSASGADTSGAMVLDTGAGHLAVDHGLSGFLGVSEAPSRAATVEMATKPLRRITMGEFVLDHVWPVLTVDAGVVRRATGRQVLGLIGQALLRDRVVVLDYASGTMALLPPESHPVAGTGPISLGLSPGVVPVPFRLVGDGKAVLRARVGHHGGRGTSELILVLDTGATKSVLFGPAMDRHAPGWRTWPALHGLGAPTLTGDAEASMVRVPLLELVASEGTVKRSGMDAAVLGGDLPRMLEAAVGGPVDGLLGYSFLKHFRIALDYPRGLLWLDGTRGGVPDRPEEYCQPGVQLESVGGSVRVMAVASGSPAARAGVRAGDELVALDGESVSGRDLVGVGRRLEGRPGSWVTLRLRRGPREWTRRVARACLL